MICTGCSDFPSQIIYRSKERGKDMVQFIRKVSDSEQIKRAALDKTETALNVILSNCTKLRAYFLTIYYIT